MALDSVEEIKNKLDVKEVVSGYLKLDKSGINYRARCPFHKEKTPSFFVSPTRQIWRCFGCGEGGDIFSFVQKIEGVDFPTALQSLGTKAGVDVKRQNPQITSQKAKSLEICDVAAKYFHGQLDSKSGNIIVSHLNKRGISEKSIEEFKLGYAPIRSNTLLEFLGDRGYDNEDILRAGIAFKKPGGEVITRFAGRIIFPIFSISGAVIAFGGRKLAPSLAEDLGRGYVEDSAKYINSPQTNIYDKSSVLYGLNWAKIPLRQEDVCVVVEGYTDVILAHQNGFFNVVSSSGTSLTPQQLNIIGRYTKKLITSFDMDVAGASATRRGIDLALSAGFDVEVISLEKGKDPADVLQENPKLWESALKNTKSIIQFYFDSALEEFDPDSAEGKREIVKSLAGILGRVESETERAHWVQKLATRLDIAQEAVASDVRKFMPNMDRSAETKDEIGLNYQSEISKREILIQHILTYALHDLSFLGLIKKRELRLFDDGSVALRILKNLLEAEKIVDTEAFVKDLDAEDRRFINELMLEIEIKLQDNKYSEEDLVQLMAAYEVVVLEEELAMLEKEIAQNEQLGEHDKNDKLLEIFHKKATKKSSISN